MRPLTEAPKGRLATIDLQLAALPARPAVGGTGPAGKRRRDSRRRRFSRGLTAANASPPATPYPIQAWSFGDSLGMVFLAGEVVADYGLRLKRELDPSRLWVNAYSNDVAFYVASRRLIPEGGYEVDRSMVFYGQPARLADDTEDRIISTVRTSPAPKLRLPPVIRCYA